MRVIAKFGMVRKGAESEKHREICIGTYSARPAAERENSSADSPGSGGKTGAVLSLRMGNLLRTGKIYFQVLSGRPVIVPVSDYALWYSVSIHKETKNN